MSFDMNGDAGTAVALEQAVELMATGEPQRVVDMIQNAPPGGIETKWGTGFRRYTECLEHMREHQLYQPLDEGAVARPAAGCAAAVDSLAPDVAVASEGCAAPLLGLLPSSWHQRAAASGAAFYHLDVFAGNL